MNNKIIEKFKNLKASKKKALIPFLTAGFPSIKKTKELVLACEQAGADIIELGIPFSDPMADGPTIQASSQYALDKGFNIDQLFSLVKSIRQVSNIPLAVMTYYNPVFVIGEEAFIKKAKAVGIDGLIIPDLPVIEADSIRAIAKKHEMALTFFLAPTTGKDRVKAIADASTGFVYYVSLTGVTGAKDAAPTASVAKIKEAKKISSQPICVGFGVSTPAQAKALSKVSDGVIVGSAIIKEIQKHQGKKDCVAKVAQFVGKLNRAIR